MKILTKKQWRMIEKRINILNNELFDERKISTKLKDKLYIEYRINCNLTHQIEDLKESKRKLASAKGGLNTRIKRLEKQLNELNLKYNELEEKYKESMTDKYLVKKLKPVNALRKTTMKLKDCSRVSNITMKYIGDYDE